MSLKPNQTFLVVVEKRKKSIKFAGTKKTKGFSSPLLPTYHVQFIKHFTVDVIKSMKITGQERIMIVHEDMQKLDSGTIMSYVKDRISKGKFTTLHQILAV